VSLRLRLIVVFFLLSVVPVGAVTYYTYATNAQAMRDAAGAEAELLAAELTVRMGTLTAQLTQRVEQLMELPESPEAEPAKPETREPARTAAATTPRSPEAVTARVETPAPPGSVPLPPAPPGAPAAPPQPTIIELQRTLGNLAELVNNIEVRGLRPRRLGPPPEGGFPRGFPNRPTAGGPGGPSAETAAAPAGDRVAAAAEGPNRFGIPRGPDGRPLGPPPDGGSAQPLESNRVLVDLREIRRQLFEELVKDREAFDQLPPEERQKVFATIEQRMQDVGHGVDVLKKALASRALEVRTQDVLTTSSGMTAPTPPVAPAPAPAPAPAATPKPAAAAARKPAAVPAAAPVAAAEPAPMKKSSSLSGRRLAVKVERGGKVVTQVDADVDLPKLLAAVFESTSRERGELPFAIGEKGELYTATPVDKQRIESLGREALATTSRTKTTVLPDWVVATTPDPTGTRLKFGIARPVGEALRDLRTSSARDAALGLGFIGLALIVIVPLSGRLTRNLDALGEGVHKIAAGDYSARVPVRSGDEIGRLAAAFNQMAADVEAHQRAVISQERIRRELELGRQIQHDMLPQTPLRLGLTEIKGVSVPAREVGGDFFNYFTLRDGTIALVVGDVSGKGVGAALLMANLQAALRTRLSLGQDLASLATELDVEIDRTTPGPVYSTLFVGILDTVSRRLRCVNAGHNPQFVLRTDGRLERMESTGRPIGLLSGGGYSERQVDLTAGDVLFFYTDGCVEAENGVGEMFGSERLERALAATAGLDADQVMVAVEAAVAGFRAGVELTDDATIMVVKVG
jgi:serine phosphatase RsbU (regulator of sigma subunit)